MNNSYRHARHSDVPPLIDENSRVLALGTTLSPKSCEAKFYYAHPQNRFWRVLSALCGVPLPNDNDERARLALSHGIALWDVIAECDIIGAADGSIKNVVYNDISGLLKKYKSIVNVFATGGKAFELLKKYNKTVQNPIIARAVRLPSTSPLNCGTSLDALVAAYSAILK